jgi:RecA-family ATPase
VTPEDFFAAHEAPPIEAYEEQVRTRSPQIEDSSDSLIPDLVFPTSLRGKPIPPMEWIVDQWIPRREVTLLYGDGGTGKTLIAQQLQASAALGKPWLTLPVLPCKSIGLFCEDDNDELHRRQNDIQRNLMTDFDDETLDNMAWWSRKGGDNLLATFDHGNKIQPTPLYYKIWEAAKKLEVGLIILDTAADLYSDSEIDRGKVRQFIGILTKMAMEANAAVVLNAHPSQAGMQSGRGDGGSTGWSNSVRSRLYLERPKGDGEEEPDTNERVLSKKKSNRSSIGDTIKLRWHDGVITPASAAGGAPTAIAEAMNAEATFLALMARCAEQGIYVSHSRNAGNFAAKIFAKRPDRAGFSLKDFDGAMHRLFARNVIRVEDYRAPNRLIRQRISLNDGA